MSKPTKEGQNCAGKCVNMGTHKYKNIWEGQEIHKKVVKILMKVLLPSVWQDCTLSEEDDTCKSHKVNKKYNLSLCSDIYFCLEQRLKHRLLELFYQMEGLKDRNIEMFCCIYLCVLPCCMHAVVGAGWEWRK